MRKNLLVAAVVLLSAAWALAQAYPSQSNSSDQNNPSAQTQTQGSESSQSSASSNAPTTVEGCLSGSEGSYTLTAKDGTTYQLTGKTSKLAKHVGHEIEVKGTTSSAASSASGMGSQAGTSGSAGSQQTLDVKSFKHISETCSTGGTH